MSVHKSEEVWSQVSGVFFGAERAGVMRNASGVFVTFVWFATFERGPTAI